MKRADLPLKAGGLPADFLPLFLPQCGLHFLRGADADITQKAARLLKKQSGGS